MNDFNIALNKFVKIKDEVKALINQYPSDKRETVLFDQWSLKDVIAHLNHWMDHDIDCIEHLKQNKEPYWYPDKDEFNKEGVNLRKNRSWDEVYAEFNSLTEKLITVYEELPVDLQNKPIWKGYNSTPLKFIYDDIRHWQGEHIPSLESNLK